jgi:hypothetical protein
MLGTALYRKQSHPHLAIRFSSCNKLYLKRYSGVREFRCYEILKTPFCGREADLKLKLPITQLSLHVCLIDSHK